MIIGVPKEIKNNEIRVALTPAGVYSLVKAGHILIVQESADKTNTSLPVRASPERPQTFMGMLT